MGKAMILAVCNEKGGVGKTSITANAGHGLARHGKKTLLVDCDPQNHLAWFLGVRDNIDVGLGDKLLDEDDKIPLGNFIMPTGRPGLEVLPAGNSLPLAIREISKRTNTPEQILTEAMGDAVEQYDFILLDVKPTWDPFTVNCMMFVSGLICPLHMDWPSVDSLGKLTKHMAPSQKYNKELGIRLLVPNQYDGREKLPRQILEKLNERLGDQVCAPIRKSVKIRDASGAGQTIFEWDEEVAQDFERVTEKILLL